MDSSSYMVKSNGMLLVKAEPEHLIEFSRTVSAENKLELREFYNLNPAQAILGLIGDDSVNSVIYKDKVVCLTSIDSSGLMWALFSADINKNGIRFVRASFSLMEYYHLKHSHIECRVWIKGGKTLQWLAFLGFEPIGVSTSPTNHQYVTFVRCDCARAHTKDELLRPVVH